jgi:hypothetical protein
VRPDIAAAGGSRTGFQLDWPAIGRAVRAEDLEGDVMKPGIALLIAIAPVIASMTAHADKQFTKGKGAAWDCGKDPVVNINHGAGTYTFTGKCTSINVNGGDNKLTIESVDTLNINGGKNTVAIGTADTINVMGSDNKVTYKTAKSGSVAANAVGSKNTIEQAK